MENNEVMETMNEVIEAADVKTVLHDLNTSKLHYIRVPEDHIVIDFDIPDENGNKSFEKNLEAASKWPPTYAELSKSGAGIHLHYIYNGDPAKLSRMFDDHIEIKVFTGAIGFALGAGATILAEKVVIPMVKAIRANRKAKKNQNVVVVKADEFSEED